MLGILAIAATACKTPVASDVRANAELSSVNGHGLRFTTVNQVEVDVENTTAFWRKVEAVRKATKSIDIAYFLYGDDFAGSYMAKELLAKAAAGVKVRMLIDAKTTLSHRDFFKALVTKGQGNLEVHYFRPIPKVIFDDFKRLGLDPAAFVNAVVMLDVETIQAQLQQSSVLRDNPDLYRSIETLARALTRRSEPMLKEMEHAVGFAGGASATAAVVATAESTPDPLLAMHVVQVLKEVYRLYRELGLQATARDWHDLTKWMHHKLLLVDGVDMIGGGRNLEDAYHWEKDHKIRVDDQIKKYVFMDVDFQVQSAELGRQALATYEAYLNPNCYVEPPLPNSCPSQIPMEKESAATTEAAEAVYAEILKKARRLEETRNYRRTYEPIHTGTFKIANARVAYAENRMLPAADGGGKLLYEEPSQYNAGLVALINDTKAGEDVIFHNAYLYFPSGIHLALIRAIKRGVNLTIISNSPESSDLGYVAQAARLQYRHFLDLGAAGPGRVEIYEYLTEESLHAKVELIGNRYTVIGSVNADPRNEFLDTNNGIFIDSPELFSQYKGWILGLKDQLLKRTRTVSLPDGTTKTMPIMRQVDKALIAKEDANPGRDIFTRVHAIFRPLAAISFQDTAEGAKARAVLQAAFLQY